MDGEGNLDYVWRHTQRAVCKLIAAKQSMKILEIVTGNTASSANGVQSTYFGAEGELTPPLVILELVAVAVDPTATVPSRVYEVVYLFKAQVKFPDMEFKAAAPGEVTIEFDAYKSVKDEQGNPIPLGFGRLASGSPSLPA